MLYVKTFIVLRYRLHDSVYATVIYFLHGERKQNDKIVFTNKVHCFHNFSDLAKLAYHVSIYNVVLGIDIDFKMFLGRAKTHIVENALLPKRAHAKTNTDENAHRSVCVFVRVRFRKCAFLP